MIEVLGVKNADKLVPTREDSKPADPVSENMDALVGKPIRAFIYQDHQAHIATHTSFMQDPPVAQMVGQNPQAQQIMASLQAHIAEHLGFQYRQQIEEKLGAPLPPPGKQLPEQIEVDLSRLVAEAGAQVMQGHQQEAAQKQAEQQQQDPVFQQKQAELQLKGQEVQRKTAKDQQEAQIKQADLQRKSQKDQVDAIFDAEKLKLDKQELELDAKKEGVRVAASRRQENNKLDLELARMMADKPKRGK
jgi:hypothetical protein